MKHARKPLHSLTHEKFSVLCSSVFVDIGIAVVSEFFRLITHAKNSAPCIADFLCALRRHFSRASVVCGVRFGRCCVRVCKKLKFRALCACSEIPFQLPEVFVAQDASSTPCITFPHNTDLWHLLLCASGSFISSRVLQACGILIGLCCCVGGFLYLECRQIRTRLSICTCLHEDYGQDYRVQVQECLCVQSCVFLLRKKRIPE